MKLKFTNSIEEIVINDQTIASMDILNLTRIFAKVVLKAMDDIPESGVDTVDRKAADLYNAADELHRFLHEQLEVDTADFVTEAVEVM